MWVHGITLIVQVVGLLQDGMHDRVRIIRSFDPEGILVKETPVHDYPHGPVVGLIRVRQPAPTSRAAIDTRPVLGKGDIRPEGISFRHLVFRTELVEIPR